MINTPCMVRPKLSEKYRVDDSSTQLYLTLAGAVEELRREFLKGFDLLVKQMSVNVPDNVFGKAMRKLRTIN